MKEGRVEKLKEILKVAGLASIFTIAIVSDPEPLGACSQCTLMCASGCAVCVMCTITCTGFVAYEIY
jgi:type III secretory pathway component EscU